MSVSKPVRIDGKCFPSARNAAAWLRGMGHPKASAAGISLAISRGQREYLGRAVEWATDDGGPTMTRRDLRHLLQWRGVDPADRAELLAMSEDGLRAMVAGTVDGPNALARAIGASLVLSRGKEWLTQSEPVNPAEREG